MTMLNAAPTATAAPTGATVVATVPTPTVPVPPTPAGAGQTAKDAKGQAEAPDVHVLGSGGTPGATGSADRTVGVTVPLDAFAKRSGPDATVRTVNGTVSVHAVFQLDDKTRQVTVAIVNEDGKLVRLIPPESVSRMIAAMAMYRGR
jgi:hypothetical protein